MTHATSRRADSSCAHHTSLVSPAVCWCRLSSPWSLRSQNATPLRGVRYVHWSKRLRTQPRRKWQPAPPDTQTEPGDAPEIRPASVWHVCAADASCSPARKALRANTHRTSIQPCVIATKPSTWSDANGHARKLLRTGPPPLKDSVLGARPHYLHHPLYLL